MAYRKEEYDAEEHHVTIQQVNEGGVPSAWIDGWAAYMDDALEHLDETPVADSVNERLEEGEIFDAYRALLAWMVSEDVYFCHKCDSFYDYETVTGTGFAGHQCGECAKSEYQCSENPDGDKHDMKITGGRNNARRPTTRKCKHCGYKNSSPPTG